MKIKLSIILIVAMFFLTLSSCTDEKKQSDIEAVQSKNVILQECAEADEEYIDSFIFIGESTTYHLKSRKVLKGGEDTKQVWGNKSGTLMLTPEIDKVKIIYPETGEMLSFYEAAAKRKPKYILLTFGLNGAVNAISKGEEYFSTSYKKLISELRRGSAKTKIIIQSCFPIAQNMDMSAYSIDAATLNDYIDTINSWSYKIAEESGCKYLDSANVFKDKNGFLKQEYQSGDGYHLTREAYISMLEFLKTHPYREE